MSGMSIPPLLLKGPKDNILERICLILLLCAVVFVYYHTLPYPFHYDDRPAIINNPGVKMPGWDADSWKRILDNAPRSDRRPIAQIGFALNYRAAGFDPAGWRAVNIVIHTINCVLVYLVGMQLMMSFRVRRPAAGFGALLGAALWGLHPVNTQAVTYIVQRMTSQMTLFFLSAFLCYLVARQSRGVRRSTLFMGTAVFFLLALGSKEVAAVFPFCLVLYELGLKGFGKKERIGKRWALLTFIGLLIYIVLLFMLFGGGEAMGGEAFGERGFSMGQRLLTETRVLMVYLSLLLFPFPGRMAIDRDFVVSTGLFEPFTTIVSITIIVLLLVVAFINSDRRPLISFSILWFFGTIFLESSFIALDLIYEHRVYLPATVPSMVMGYYLVSWIAARFAPQERSTIQEPV